MLNALLDSHSRDFIAPQARACERAGNQNHI